MGMTETHGAAAKALGMTRDELHQAQANTMKSSLTQRITDWVNGVRPARGQGRGMRGPGWSSATGDTSGATSSAPSGTT